MVLATKDSTGGYAMSWISNVVRLGFVLYLSRSNLPIKSFFGSNIQMGRGKLKSQIVSWGTWNINVGVIICNDCLVYTSWRTLLEFGDPHRLFSGSRLLTAPFKLFPTQRESWEFNGAFSMVAEVVVQIIAKLSVFCCGKFIYVFVFQYNAWILWRDLCSRLETVRILLSVDGRQVCVHFASMCLYSFL